MANLTIKDTGYIKVNGTGTVYSGSDIVNSGNAVELKSVSISYERGANVDNSVGPSRDSNETNWVSANNPTVTISGRLMRGSLDGTGTDLENLAYLEGFVRTKGIKCLYYNDTLTDTTGYPAITKFLGSTDAYTNHPTEKHLHVRFTSFTITQDATSNAYTFRLTGVVTD